MKMKFIFSLLLMVVCGNVFSQRTKIISFPYIFTVDKNEFKITQAIDTIPVTGEYCYSYDLQKIDTGFNTIYALGIRCTDECCSVFLIDVNEDGFPDIVTLATLWEPVADVLLYNPIKNDFEFSSGDFFLERDSTIHIKLIDRANNIYCDWGCQKSYSSDSSILWYSCLFQIKDYVRNNIGIITNEKDSVTGLRKYRGEKLPNVETTVGVSKVYKIKNRNRYISEIIGNFYDKSSVKEIEMIKDKNFDYATYWQLHWKNFLNN